MPLMAGRAIVQNDAAADGLHGGVEPDNEAVPPLHRHRLRKAQLGKAGLARLQRILLQQHHLGDVGGSPVVEVYRGAVLDDAVGVLQIGQAHVQHPGQAQGIGLAKGIAPHHGIPPQARQIYRHPLPGVGLLHRVVVDLQGADLGPLAGGHQLHRVAYGEVALDHGAGDHGAEAVLGEHPVHRQTEGDLLVADGHPAHPLLKLLFQLRDALTGISGHRQDRFAL